MDALAWVPDGMGISLSGIALVGPFGALGGFTLHVDFVNPSNTGLYFVPGVGAGYDVSGSVMPYVVWGTQGQAYGGTFYSGQLTVPTGVPGVQAGGCSFTNARGIWGAGFVLSFSPLTRWGWSATVQEFIPGIGGQDSPAFQSRE